MAKTLSIAPMFILAAALPVAAETVYSDPAGFVKLGNTTADEPAVPAETDVSLALPLERELEFTGMVASAVVTSAGGEEPVTATITVQGSPGWTTSPENQWAASAEEPYCVIVRTGAEAGLRGLISSNGTDSIDFTLTTPGDPAAIAMDDVVEIRKCWTLASVFASTALTNNCFVYIFDQSKSGINHAGYPFIYSGGIWYDGVLGTEANGTVIFPGERFIFRSATSDIPEIPLFGEVGTAPTRISLKKDGTGTEDMEVSPASPVPLVVGDLALPAQDNDWLRIFDNTTPGINKSGLNLIRSGSDWYNGVTGFPVTDTFVIQPGQAFVLRRDANSDADAEWVEPAAWPPAPEAP